MNSLKIIFLSFLDICLLKKKPQDLPGSLLFLGLCALVYMITSFLQAFAYQDFNNALFIAFADVCLMIFITRLLLAIIRKPGRWIQTGTALLGTGTLFSLVASPIYYSLSISGGNESGDVLLTLIIWILIVWNVIVMAHILRHALSVSFAMGILMSLAYVFVISSTIIMLITERAV